MTAPRGNPICLPTAWVALPGRGSVFVRDDLRSGSPRDLPALLHGWPLSPDTNFFGLMPSLARRYPFVGFDQRGHDRTPLDARTGRLPDLGVPNMAEPGTPIPTFFGAYGQWMQTAPPTWDDVAWLRAQWDGPFLLKGVIRVDEARRAVDAGVSAISVSNHGGNNLDGTPATIRALPPIADAVGEQVEVLLDGVFAAAVTS